MRGEFSVGKLIILILVILFFIWLNWLIQPAVSINYGSSIFFYGLAASIILGLIVSMFSEDSYEFTVGGITIGIIIGIISIIIIIGGFLGSAIFTHRIKYTQLGDVKEEIFKETIPPTDLIEIPYVDSNMAKKMGDKKLGKDLNLGNLVDIGTFYKQEVNGKLVLVAPLEHENWWKYRNSKSGTPGYIIVSASNPNDVKLVTDINGESVKIKYQQGAYFEHKLHRYIRQNGYKNMGLTDYSFELNDEGFPYWVVTTYKNTTIFGTPEATGVIVVNATNGDINQYKLGKEPDWVDIVQPDQFIKKQISNMGRFPNKVINPSKKDEFRVTDGMGTIYYNGDCYYYTGLTSAGGDAATIGFMFVNTRTKKAIKYIMEGAHENAAMNAAEGKVESGKEFKATFPLPFNVNGQPTYFLTLKDPKEGLIKYYAFINIESYSIVGLGETISEARNNYISKLYNSGNSIAGSNDAYRYELESVVIDRINSYVQDGTSMYSFTIVDNELIFNASLNISEELKLSMPGDKINILYIDDKNLGVSVETFDNLMLTTRKSDAQIIKEEADKAVMKEQISDSATDVNSEANEDAWAELSDEEKAKLLEELDKKE